MKLIKVKKDENGIDSVAYRKTTFGDDIAINLLEQCATLWENLRYFRRARERALRFAYGDQWGDYIVVNGVRMKEREYISRIGNTALQTNQIKKVVNTIAGVWNKQQFEPVCYARDNEEKQFGQLMSELMKTNWQSNKMPVLMNSSLEEVLIGGLAIAREHYGLNNSGNKREDAWTTICNPNYVFFDSGMKDPRFWDLSIVGELHDVDFNEICEKFAETPEDFKKLREWYYPESSMLKQNDSLDTSDKNREEGMSFYTPRDTKKCRVIEVWTKERRPRYHVWDKQTGDLYDIDADDTEALKQIEKDNKERKKLAPSDWEEDEIPLIEKSWFVDTFWYYRFLTPQGRILSEGESTEPDKTQPYTLLAVPFTNGKIVSYIKDAIDQNIAINHILTLDDWIRRTGAKGITMVPKTVIPDDMDYRTFAEQWTSIDGIVFYQPRRDGAKPETFYGNTSQLNTAELVKMMNDLMESSVSVSGAIQGKTPYAGTSGALYSLQTENSSTPISTLMEKFNMFVESIATKKAKYMKENYTVDRYVSIAGRVGLAVENLRLNEAKDIECDLAIKQSTETPTFRAANEEWLMDLYELSAPTGQMTLMDLLMTSNNPIAEELAERIQARQQELLAAGAQAPTVGADYDQKRRQIIGQPEGNA